MTKGSATSPPTLIIFSRVAKFIIFRYRYFLPINIVYNLITVIINEKKERERERSSKYRTNDRILDNVSSRVVLVVMERYRYEKQTTGRRHRYIDSLLSARLANVKKNN